MYRHFHIDPVKVNLASELNRLCEKYKLELVAVSPDDIYIFKKLDETLLTKIEALKKTKQDLDISTRLYEFPAKSKDTVIELFKLIDDL